MLPLLPSDPCPSSEHPSCTPALLPTLCPLAVPAPLRPLVVRMLGRASLCLLAPALLLPALLTPLQLWRQVQLATRWSPFWHTNTHLAAHCPLKAVTCVTDLKCLQAIACINTCMLDNLHAWDKVAQCAYICEMTHGYENEPLHDLLNCMLANGVLEQYPRDGPCLGGDGDAVGHVRGMEDIQGDWWVVRGVNCGAPPYPGGYDWYPCQHERFLLQVTEQSSKSWTNLTRTNTSFVVTIIGAATSAT